MTTSNQVACILAELSPTERASLLGRLTTGERAQLAAIDMTVPSSSAAALPPPERQTIQAFVKAAAQESSRSGVTTSHGRLQQSLDDVATYPPEAIANVLRKELPQTIAAILIALPETLAAEVLVAFPVRERAIIVDRIAESSGCPLTITADVLGVVADELCSHTSGDCGKLKIQAIISAASIDAQSQLCSTLEQSRSARVESHGKSKSA
ncbi:MAG: hypothetical protein KDB27_24870 [Planctomycetales bacterium]|nr:hypothetical protein [Planctomycetales bacterium]